QRVNKNWALLFAQQKAIETNSTLEVFFVFYDKQPKTHPRNIKFMLEGLKEVESNLSKLHIPFNFILGNAISEVIKIANNKDTTCIVTDFSPSKYKRRKIEKIVSQINIALYEVDAHNIVPCWIASAKQEFSAKTFRPKITKLLSKFLTTFPKVKKQNKPNLIKKINWDYYFRKLEIEKLKSAILIKPGESEAVKKTFEFINHKLDNYKRDRNDPTKDALSGLSAYLHFGHICSQQVVLEIKKRKEDENTQTFLEEIIVRKELSDNYCYYNQNYDNINGIPNWAKKELIAHLQDKREHIYSLPELEESKTHDNLWNAANTEMVILGKMHGYLRMYWAKKILEWTKSPEEAVKIAIHLNDKYELDGRDPNGYVGILWSIGGLHDRPFFTRPVIGKIRPMTKTGLEKKFNIKAYLQQISNLRQASLFLKKQK
ncbi:MAG: deoxyribodipyrimidine photo-lyase, partial [Patescibacteria group bacterium]|nr:deoxyribodipyrimidine photo-lyase [Patescibacteria group bacterium]